MSKEKLIPQPQGQTKLLRQAYFSEQAQLFGETLTDCLISMGSLNLVPRSSNDFTVSMTWNTKIFDQEFQLCFYIVKKILKDNDSWSDSLTLEIELPDEI